ncbi:Peptidyl-prolyl cis-trans isomerase PpiD [hydrothermal vent metagenome]|uniref:Periplasmic chaperone PpiD n=1 Tax=hydrothermal vent metagenome TaxID=652676 RepID=A0A3B0ZSH8_9ZZZZ
MLMQAIRDRAQSWIAWVIVSLLIVVFAFWGISSYLEPDSNASVATVNGVDIKYNQFQHEYDLKRSQLMSQFGGNISPEMLESLGIKDQVLQQLVDEEIQYQTLGDRGFRVGDQQLFNMIAQFPEFQVDGIFDRARYEQMLGSIRSTPVIWEYQQRRALLLEQPARGVASTVLVSKVGLSHMVKVRDQERSVGYVVLSAKDYEDKVTVEEAEIKTYYDSNLERYKNPEQVSVEYVELSADDLKKNIAVDEGELLMRYQAQEENYAVEERRQASHILVEVDPDGDESEKAAAKSKAEAILSRLENGESFEDLAAAESDDPLSAKKGGDLGFFESAFMDKSFVKATYALEKGQMSGVVRSGFGFHIIKLTDIEPRRVKPFADVRSMLEDEYLNEKAEDFYYDQIEQLETLAYENPESLSVVSDILGLEIKTSELFSRDFGSGIAQEDKVRAAAFGDDVMENKNNSEAVELGANKILVLRVKEHNTESTKKLDEVRAQVKRTLKRDKARNAVQVFGDELLKQAQSGADVGELLVEDELEWDKPGFIGRQYTDMDNGLVSAIFKTVKPKAEESVYGTYQLTSGDYALYAIYGVQDGDIKSLKEEDRKSMVEGQTQMRGVLDYRSMLEGWKKSADVQTYPDRL